MESTTNYDACDAEEVVQDDSLPNEALDRFEALQKKVETATYLLRLCVKGMVYYTTTVCFNYATEEKHNHLLDSSELGVFILSFFVLLSSWTLYLQQTLKNVRSELYDYYHDQEL